ncbi:TetR family transcriptional regulator [Rhodococcus sp. NPDC003318]|uniref:TetR/AcrR family transcriptional regulator n=1 Tax=Rhodococcus sp. NPDC003318 TaxID=3364503 RepID=UPI0036BB9512
MSERTTRDVILDAARTLFAERGFTLTTIRDVAEAADVSPALVMKLTGSKAELFQAAAPEAPTLEEQAQQSEPAGRRLVRTIVERRDSGDFEYWAIAPFILQEAPDREAAREEMAAGFVPRIARSIGDDSAGQVRSRLVVTLLLGLASGLRTFEILAPEAIDSGSLIDTYGALVQAIIDNPEL